MAEAHHRLPEDIREARNVKQFKEREENMEQGLAVQAPSKSLGWRGGKAEHTDL